MNYNQFIITIWFTNFISLSPPSHQLINILTNHSIKNFSIQLIQCFGSGSAWTDADRIQEVKKPRKFTVSYRTGNIKVKSKDPFVIEFTNFWCFNVILKNLVENLLVYRKWSSLIFTPIGSVSEYKIRGLDPNPY